MNNFFKKIDSLDGMSKMVVEGSVMVLLFATIFLAMFLLKPSRKLSDL